MTLNSILLMSGAIRIDDMHMHTQMEQGAVHECAIVYTVMCVCVSMFVDVQSCPGLYRSNV